LRTFRILHVESSRGAGGQEIRILLEAQTMSRHGHAVKIIAQPNSFLAKQAQEMGLSTITFRMNWLLSGLLLFSFIRIIKKYGIQVLVTHGSIDSWTTFVAGRLSSLKPIMIRARHKSTPISQTWRHQWLYKYLPHGVMTTSERVRKDMITRQMLDPDRTFSVPTGVDLGVFDVTNTENDLRKEFEIGKESIVLGTVAFLRDYKGIHLCLDAVALLKYKFPSLRFLVVGDGPEASRLKEKAKALGIQSQIKFLGFRSDVNRVMASLDIFVLPSTAGEGVPQVITQAMAMGVPVVAAATGGIPEVVQHDVTGLLVQANDVNMLANNLLKLIDDDVLRTRLGRKGRELIVRSFSIDSMIDKIEDMYGNLWKKEKGAIDIMGVAS
jgi:glycosyltransferase involved in cell wall biosynthesis